MLDDAAVERYSRQILLDEVGGRGQERLCATRVTVVGRGRAAAFAATLLDAAGLRVDVAQSDDESLEAIIEGAGVVRARGDVVATLVGGPCVACADDEIWTEQVADPAAPDAPLAQAIGAVVAAEAIRMALGLVRAGRVYHVDAACGGTHELPAVARCPVCPTPS